MLKLSQTKQVLKALCPLPEGEGGKGLRDKQTEASSLPAQGLSPTHPAPGSPWMLVGEEWIRKEGTRARQECTRAQDAGITGSKKSQEEKMNYIHSQTLGPQEPAAPLHRLNLCRAGEGSLGFIIPTRLSFTRHHLVLFSFFFFFPAVNGSFLGDLRLASPL